MAKDLDTLTGIIQAIIADNFKYAFPRRGQVVEIIDPVKKGRILVVIPDFGWDTPDKGVWCRPVDTGSLKTPPVDSWVVVMWMNGNPDEAIYLGTDTNMKDVIPKSYVPNSQVLFEGIDNKIRMVYNEKENEMLIGNVDFREASRKEDAIEAIIPANTVVVSVTGGSGAPAVGIKNPAPIVLDGTIQEGSSQIKIGDKE